VSKTSVSFEKSLDEMKKLINTTLANIFELINRRDTSNKNTLDELNISFESTKSKQILVSDEDLLKTNKNFLKLKLDAPKVRVVSVNQKTTAYNFNDLITQYIKKTRTSLSDLNDLIQKKSQLQLINNDLSYESLTKNSQVLIKESNDLHKSIENKINNLKNLNKELADNQFQENKYDSDIQSAKNRVDDNFIKLKETKIKVDEMTNKIDKYSSDSAIKVKKVENDLSGFNLKNEVLYSLKFKFNKIKTKMPLSS
jgi:chromosome segregation ATPase